MNPEGPRSLLGHLFSSKPAVKDQRNGLFDSRPERPRIITEEVEQPLATSPESFEFSQHGASIGEKSDGPDPSKPSQDDESRLHHSQSASSLSNVSARATLSPAAMFLSSFAASPAKVVLPDDEGEVVAGYTLGGVIGYGGFSTIRRAFSASGGGAVAVKIVRRSDLSKDANPSLARKRLDHETEVWSTLSHEHILPLFTSVHTSYADFFVTLLCPAGSLFDILKREGRPALPQDDAGMMFRQVVRGINYLHEVAGIVHRDIKLENVLVDESGMCRITDFGLARKIGENVEEEESADEPGPLTSLSVSVGNGTGVHRAASVSQSHFTGQSKKPKTGVSVHESLLRPHGHGPRHRNSTTTSTQPTVHTSFQPGSLPYAAPELLTPPQKPGPLVAHPAQDIWALGILLFGLLTGRLPFMDSYEPRLQLKILHGVYEIPTGIGHNAERVLKGCLDSCVQSRWNILMVDEVAWSIGWGSDVNVQPIVSDEELRRETSSASMSRSTSQCAGRSSRSRSRPADINVPSNWEYGDTRSPGSADAASRRSISRAKRSLSRAPVLTDQSSSARNVERSLSRPRSSRGRLARLHTPRSGSLSSCSSASSDKARSASLVALEVTDIAVAAFSSASESSAMDATARSAERGRRLHKTPPGTTILIPSTSRSPSPSVVPSTPVDYHPRYSRSLSPPTPDDEELEEYDYPPTREHTDAIDNREVHFRERGRKPTKEVPESSGVRQTPYWGLTAAAENLLEDENDAGLDEEQSRHEIPFRPSPGPIVFSRSDGNVQAGLGDVAEKGYNGLMKDSNQRPYYSYSTPRLQHTMFGKQRAGSTPPGPLSSWSAADSGHTSTLRFTEFSRSSPSHSRASYSRAHSRDGLPAMSGMSGISGISGLPVVIDTKDILKRDDAEL